MGKRGEGWFVVQMVLFLLILITPHWITLHLPGWARWTGIGFLVAGGILGTAGIFNLGRNLTPFPKPIENGTLVETYAYSVVRHPIYSGLIFGTLGWSLWQSHALGLILALLLFLFFDLKSRREEKWLVETYPAYTAYQKRVRKLIPFVY